MKKFKELTVVQLAAVLYEELEIDGWGDIDPQVIRGVAAGCIEIEDKYYIEDVEGMENVLERVCKRLNDMIEGDENESV